MTWFDCLLSGVHVLNHNLHGISPFMRTINDGS